MTNQPPPDPRSEIFNQLKQISILKSQEAGVVEARRLTLSLLERAATIPDDLLPIVQDFLVALGYFPYLDQIKVNDFRAEMHKEFHRSESLPNIVLHKEQFLVSELLSSGKSVILSAPTSFGKTLLIEEVVARRKYKNIVIIEPTLALIDELRNKLKKYEDHYKIVFSKGQTPSENNVFLLTQERLVDFENLPSIDFFVIDEFYKLTLEEDDRTDTLNHAFYLLLKMTKNFYLLGPPIRTVPIAFLNAFSCELRVNNFETVNVSIKSAGKRSAENLFKLLSGLSEQTLIYSKGPGSCETTANKFLEKTNQQPSFSNNTHVIEWIAEYIHEEWSLSNLLKHGIAFHHGSLPRHISRYIVDAFNKGDIKYLFCTSTLIEGVNTSAKNVVVYDGKKGPRDLTKFDLRNIAGRAGRMNQYLSGNVFMFIPDPQGDTDFVDIPWYSQENVSDALLVQLEEPDLKPDSKDRVKRILENPHLTGDVIRKNSNITPDGQISLAEKIRNEPGLYELLSWTSYPNWKQLEGCCGLIWDFLLRKTADQREVDGLLSAKQLAYITSRYRQVKVPNALIRDYMAKKPEADADEAVAKVMGWTKKWFEYKLPKLLMSLNNIQEEVYNGKGLKPGNYKFFSSELESGFLPPAVSALREMGIPAELGRKLIRVANISSETELDQLIKDIRQKLDHSQFTEYEKILLAKI